MSSSIKQIESIMTGLGFTAYEARAYSALVREAPLTGYELSKRSSVPGSKVYEAIERLHRKRLVIQVGDNPARYAAVPPDELMKRLSNDFESSISTLETLLKKDMAPETVDYIFNMHGYHDIITKAAEMIGDADHSLDLSLWDPEITELEVPIRDAVARGVNITMLSFDADAPEGVTGYRHRSIEPHESVERWITVVSDGVEALTGQCSGEGGIVAAWTRNRCLVFISVKYIEHEILKIKATV